MGRILAVDPGDARIGLALSDPTRTIARPHKILKHQSRQLDAQSIAAEAVEADADLILVGLALDQDGLPGPQARKALRLVEVLQRTTEIEITTWDETGTTQTASRLGKGDGPVDARAASVLLQEYLDAQA